MAKRGFRRLLVVAALVAWVGTPAAAASADDAVWALLKGGGQVVMIRHAKTDGSTGDPPGFKLDDCATQRNLLDQGREDAQRIGRTFAARGVPVGEVLSSRWCRCLETARLAFGRVEPWNPLMAGARDQSRLGEIRERVGGWRGPGTLVLVSHAITIRAATNEWLSEGELLVLTPRGGSTFKVAGRILPGLLDD
jgi:broad specificity phosphatase PhoE